MEARFLDSIAASAGMSTEDYINYFLGKKKKSDNEPKG